MRCLLPKGLRPIQPTGELAHRLLPWFSGNVEVTVRFIRTRQVLEMIGVGRTTLWKMVQAGAFPRPVRITERSSGYLLEAVEQWMRLRADGLPWPPAADATRSRDADGREGRARLALARRPETAQGPAR